VIRRAATTAALVALAACGGGGGDPDAHVELGRMTVTGSVSYEDRAPQASGSLGAPVPKVARNVTVALVTLSGDTIGSSVTAEDGTFTIESTVDVAYGDSVHILAATTSNDATRPVEVVRPDGNIHGFGGAGFEAAVSANTDLLVSETSGEAGAFNVYDTLLEAVDRVAALGLTPEPLSAVWLRGNQNGTYYSSGENTMYLLGGTGAGAGDDDGYDDLVILHEAGHYIEYTHGRSDSPGGNHGGEPVDPNLAWSEGFSTYFALAVTNAPIYIDTASPGGWSYNSDTSTTVATGSGMGQDLSEDLVSEVLWDLGDAGGDDDPFVGDHGPVLLVQPEYLRTGALRGGNEPGVDLVDFLDGFFVADGLTHCAAVRAIVTTTRGFPYDYNGPGGSCP
jgi:hypothetical protein